MYERVVQINELADLDGHTFRYFEECFKLRFLGQTAVFSQQDKKSIHELWKTAVRKYYHGLQPPQKTRLIRINNGRKVIAVPNSEDSRILEAVLTNWRNKKIEKMRRDLASVNISSPQAEQRDIQITTTAPMPEHSDEESDEEDSDD